jgi:hypothetical protein
MGLTETDSARLLAAAREQSGEPLVVVWDNLNAHISRAMVDLVAARDRLPSASSLYLKSRLRTVPGQYYGANSEAAATARRGQAGLRRR